jgi:thioredoxin-related protein
MTIVKNVIIAVFSILSAIGFAQETDRSTESREVVKWMTFEEVSEAMKVEKRKIFVDMYTEWCSWCKRMDRNTFQKSHIAEFLNKNFYPVRFNAEQKEDVQYKNKTYKYVRSGGKGYNTLAVEFAQSLGKLSFPTVIFIDEEYNIIQAIPTYQGADQFEAMMNYFAGDHFKNTPWNVFYRNFLIDRGLVCSNKCIERNEHICPFRNCDRKRYTGKDI